VTNQPSDLIYRLVVQDKFHLLPLIKIAWNSNGRARKRLTLALNLSLVENEMKLLAPTNVTPEVFVGRSG
jgi:hypothetical protein